MRFFDILASSNTTLTLSKLSLKNGEADEGGAIRVGIGATLVISGSRISDSHATTGGGIMNRGTVTVSDSTLAANSAESSGGAIRNDTNAILTITNSTILNNTAPLGGGVYVNSSTITLGDGSQLRSNTATLYGGAVYLTGDGASLSDNGSTFDSNSASLFGGAICKYQGTVTSIASTYINNSAPTSGGGAIANLDSGNLTVRDDTFTNNTASNGAAIYDDTSFASVSKIRRSTFSENNADQDGGAIYYSSPRGGAMYVVNSTFSNNTGNNGAAIYNTGLGKMFVANSTLYGNIAVFNAAIFNDNSNNPFILENSIIAGTTGYGTAVDDCVNSISVVPRATMEGHNNRTSNFCWSYSAPFNLGPVTGLSSTLQNNGGLTSTHKILRSSNAIDQGYANCRDPFSGTALQKDQRGPGFSRPKDGNADGTATCDIGAYEASGLSVTPAPF